MGMRDGMVGLVEMDDCSVSRWDGRGVCGGMIWFVVVGVM